MRQVLIKHGATELSYEIRNIVKKAKQLERLGKRIYWENIGDPVQKRNEVPIWIREVVAELAMDSASYSYSDSKGELATREFLADKNNQLGGTQIGAEDILFFNGLGDAIAKLYEFIVPASRVIGPSPAYSTHSSGEGAHADAHPLTYRLDPNNSWYPDMDDLYNQVRYNPNVVGILIINPDNPTGMVYPREILAQIVEIARTFDLFLISDEIYYSITYNGAKTHALAEVIGEVPGLAMKGISKEMPWPGARCGWVEFYNRHNDPEFDRLSKTLEDAKMVEVCSTKLPQLAIPKVMSDPRFQEYRKQANAKIGERSKMIGSILGDLPQIRFNSTYGAFYNTIIFKEDWLKKAGKRMTIDDPAADELLQGWIQDGMPDDQRFVYQLLASKQVCVVPVSSFCSDLQGFRVTLLEEDPKILQETFERIRAGIIEYFT